MSDYHVGDIVYVPFVGSVTEIRSLVTTRNMVATSKLVGYETDFGVLTSDQMELVEGGEDRRMVEEYLERRRRKSE